MKGRRGCFSIGDAVEKRDTMGGDSKSDERECDGAKWREEKMDAI